MRPQINMIYVTPAMIAEKWNEEKYKYSDGDDNKWKGEYITKKFRKILKAIEDRVGENKSFEIRKIYKSALKNVEIGEKPKTDWIFLDVSEFLQYFQKEEEASLHEIMHPELLFPETLPYEEVQFFTQLMEQNREYQFDTSETMKKLFELWDNAKKGFFTYWEANLFSVYLKSLMPWYTNPKGFLRLIEEINTIRESDEEPEAEHIKKLRMECDELVQLKSGKSKIEDLIFQYYLSTRNQKFIIKRCLSGKRIRTKRKVTASWAIKWNYIMECVCKCRDLKKDGLTEKGGDIGQWDIEELVKCFQIIYDFRSKFIEEWITKIDMVMDNKMNEDQKKKIQHKMEYPYNEGISDYEQQVLKDKENYFFTIGEYKKKGIKLEKHRLKELYPEDHKYILEKAFGELEERLLDKPPELCKICLANV